MVEVLKSGFYTTVQDLGRYYFQHYGVPISGAMDHYSVNLANALLNNEKNEAVLEMTMTGPSLKFHRDTQICISGADMSPRLNDQAVNLNHVIPVKHGDLLNFGKLQYGFRSYLAVSDGFKTPLIMDSRSMYQVVTGQSVVMEGDRLALGETQHDASISNASIKINENHFSTQVLEVFKGPEFDRLPRSAQDQLLSREFTIAKENNRMAYQLKETFRNKLESIITSVVLPGTVQLTPNGRLIILMRDCQTTGGYPRILQLKANAINILSQKYVGHNIAFNLFH
jgi:biotin-dependent carboxylase-like uncharacterized protein